MIGSDMSEDDELTLYNLGKITVRYCKSWSAMAASADSPTDAASIEPELLEETTKIGEELETFLINYFFTLTDIDLETLSFEQKNAVEMAAVSAKLSASYTEPDITHMMKPPMSFSREDSINTSYGYMLLQMFMELFPFKIEVDDYIIGRELEKYRGDN